LSQWQSSFNAGYHLGSLIGKSSRGLLKPIQRLKTPLVLGALLVLYGAIGIYLHPTHPAFMQAAKLLAPIPLVLCGGWLRLRCNSSRGAPAINSAK